MENEQLTHTPCQKGRNWFYRTGLSLIGLLACVMSSLAQTQNVSFVPAARNLFALHNSEEDRSGRVADASNEDALPPAPSYTSFLTQAPASETEQPAPAANPGRPAMATPALLTPVGYAQIETGFLYARDSAQFSNRNSEEETMRITVNPRTQFIIAGEPVAGSQSDDQTLVQHGDTTAGVQLVAMPGQGIKPTLSASYLRLLHGGDATSLDIGGYVNSAILMQSADLGHFHVDCNEFFNETEGPIRRLQTGQAAAVTYPLTPKLGAIAELRHFTDPLAGGDGLSTLWGAAYAVRPNLVVDTGLVHGLTGTSTQWQVLSGVTYVLPHRIGGFSHGSARP